MENLLLKKQLEKYFIYVWNQNLISEKYENYSVNKMCNIFNKKEGIKQLDFELLNAAFIVFNYPREKIFSHNNYKNVSLDCFVVEGVGFKDLKGLVNLLKKSLNSGEYELDGNKRLIFNCSKLTTIEIKSTLFNEFLTQLLGSIYEAALDSRREGSEMKMSENTELLTSSFESYQLLDLKSIFYKRKFLAPNFMFMKYC